MAQELWRRKAFLNKKNYENLAFWQSESHEIDFVMDGTEFYEVKLGQASALYIYSS